MPNGWMPTKRQSDTSWTLQGCGGAEGQAQTGMQRWATGPHGPGGGAGTESRSRLGGAVLCDPRPAAWGPSRHQPFQVVQRQLVVEQLRELEQLAHGDVFARSAGIKKCGVGACASRAGKKNGAGQDAWVRAWAVTCAALRHAPSANPQASWVCLPGTGMQAARQPGPAHRMRCMNWYSSSALVAVSPLRLRCMSLAISATVSCAARVAAVGGWGGGRVDARRCTCRCTGLQRGS